MINHVTEPTNQPNDSLWEILKRYDFYVESSNTRATTIVAFDTFIFSGITLNWKAILPPPSKNNDVVQYFAIALLSVAVISSLISLWKAFSVIDPFIRSANESGAERLQSFFCLGVPFYTPEKTIEHLQHLTKEELSKHLSRQVYDIGEALKMKFANLQVSVNAIVWGQLIPMSVLSCINLLNLILQV